MRTQQKRVELYDGLVTKVMKDANSALVSIENGYYNANKKEYVKEEVIKSLDNPAQAEGLENGTKVALFTVNGKTNLVREGEWKASEAVMAKSKTSGKEYDNGVTVIMGKCINARLVTPKEGQNFEPFFTMAVITNDHTRHNISINNRAPYEADAIEKAMEKFKNFLENDKHGFIPFTGTFVTQKSYKQEEVDREFNGQTYHNVDRSYSGLLALGSYQDYEKAPEKTYTQKKEQSAPEAEQHSSLDMNAELGEDLEDEGFEQVEEEELPFD